MASGRGPGRNRGLKTGASLAHWANPDGTNSADLDRESVAVCREPHLQLSEASGAVDGVDSATMDFSCEHDGDSSQKSPFDVVASLSDAYNRTLRSADNAVCVCPQTRPVAGTAANNNQISIQARGDSQNGL